MNNFIYDLNKNLNFRNIRNDIRMIENIMNRKEYDYLSYLLYPEKYKGVKIPTEIPIPSCSFQMHNNIEINLDTNGNLFIMYNPFFLGNLKGVIFPCKTTLNPNIQYAQLTFLSSLFINNNNTKWGGKYYAVNMNQCIPDVYDQYRLVSGSISVRYIGRLDIVSGVIGAGTYFEDTSLVATGQMIFLNANLTRIGITEGGTKVFNEYDYNKFNKAEDYEEYQLIRGVRKIYYPIDKSYLDFYPVFNDDYIYSEENSVMSTTKPGFTDYKNGLWQGICIINGPPKGRILIDIYNNFECLPDAKFLNYLPLSTCPGCCSDKELKSIYDEVRNRSINKLNKNLKKYIFKK